MANRTFFMPDRLHEYILEVTPPESDVEMRLRQETARLPNAHMQIGRDQARVMAFLAETLGARRAIEVGTFTGYSALAIASVLPEDGYLLCLDHSAEWTAVARRYWKEAGIDHKVELRIAPALDSLESLRAERPEPFDFAFLDAEKTQYDAYYEHILPMMRTGGLILFDNTLQHGRVTDPEEQGESVRAIRALNLRIRDDSRVRSCMLAIGDGILMARKI